MREFEDFRGIKYTPKDLHRRLVSVYCEIFSTALRIGMAREADEVELAVKKAEALIKIAEELTKLYTFLIKTAEEIYKK